MGCDIHAFIEINDGNVWKVVLPEEISLKSSYAEEDDLEIDLGRSYDSFALISGVRNYVNVPPISSPRGLPDDISMEVFRNREEWGIDGHSDSWIKLKDFNEYDWSSEFKDSRISQIRKEDNVELSKASYFGGKIDGDEDELYYYKCIIRKSEDLKEYFMIKTIMETLKKLEKKYEKVRMVFWFDN